MEINQILVNILAELRMEGKISSAELDSVVYRLILSRAKEENVKY